MSSASSRILCALVQRKGSDEEDADCSFEADESAHMVVDA